MNVLTRLGRWNVGCAGGRRCLLLVVDEGFGGVFFVGPSWYLHDRLLWRLLDSTLCVLASPLSEVAGFLKGYHGLAATLGINQKPSSPLFGRIEAKHCHVLDKSTLIKYYCYNKITDLNCL